MKYLYDLLRRCFSAFLVISGYLLFEHFYALDALLPVVTMDSSHSGAVLLFVFSVYVPVSWLLVCILGVWFSPKLLEVKLALILPLMAYFILPSAIKMFYSEMAVTELSFIEQNYNRKVELFHLVNYLGSALVSICIALLTIKLANIRASKQ